MDDTYSSLPQLSVLIATCRPEGIERVAGMQLPEVEDVHYWVSWQEHADTPVPEVLAARRDVTVLRSARKGLSANRNDLLDNAKGEIFLIADDDLRYTPEQLKAVIATMLKNPQTEIATFMYSGSDNKSYPATECDLHRLPKGLNITSFEIAIRNNERTGRLRFSELMGIGAPVLTAGEDDLFMLDARRSGLNCKFFPIAITHHSGLTTGFRKITDAGVIKASGAYITMAFPLTSPLRIPLKAYRLWHNGHCGFWCAMINLTAGVIYAFKEPALRKRIFR